MRRPFLAAAMLGLAAPALAQAPARPAEQPREGGTLTIALNSDIRSLEPATFRDSNTDTVIHTFSEGLVGYRADLSVGPALAESWEVSPDGRRYAFRIRNGARFHNGAAVTSGDVAAFWRRRTDASAQWLCKRFFDGSAGLKVEAVETPDPRTVTFVLAEPNALFLAQLANIQCGFNPIHADSWGPDGTFRTPIATGPFRVREWRSGQYVALERVPDYVPLDAPSDGYAGSRRAYVNEVRFRIIPDPAATEAALYAGEVDVWNDLPPLKMQEARARRMNVDQAAGLGWQVMLVQTRDPLLRDPRMRRAIAHAIDLNGIARARTAGTESANPSIVPRGSSYFGEEFLAWPAPDPARARALAREAGYNGQVIRIQTNRRYDGMYESAVIAQSMLQAAGFRAELEVLDWATQLDRYYKGNFQLQAFGYSARFDPGLLAGVFTGDKDRNGFMQWETPAAVELMNRLNLEADPARRRAMLVELHRMMAEEVPIIGLYYDPVLEAWGPRVRGYRPWAANRPRAWGVWKAG